MVRHEQLNDKPKNSCIYLQFFIEMDHIVFIYIYIYIYIYMCVCVCVRARACVRAPNFYYRSSKMKYKIRELNILKIRYCYFYITFLKKENDA
jgi:hypothetical protein